MEKQSPIYDIKQTIDHKATGQIVRQARTTAGLSLRALAGLLNVSGPFLSDLERGNRGWTDERFNRAMGLIKGAPKPVKGEPEGGAQ